MTRFGIKSEKNQHDKIMQTNMIRHFVGRVTIR